MAQALTERRATPRIWPAVSTGLTRARLRAGKTAHIINLSANGALIETEWRLCPGSRVELQVGDAAVPLTIRARILRCHVSVVRRDRVRYRGALKFETPIPLS